MWPLPGCQHQRHTLPSPAASLIRKAIALNLKKHYTFYFHQSDGLLSLQDSRKLWNQPDPGSKLILASCQLYYLGQVAELL